MSTKLCARMWRLMLVSCCRGLSEGAVLPTHSHALIITCYACGWRAYVHKFRMRCHRALRITATGQPCSSFGIHPELDVFKELYDSKELAFAASPGPKTFYRGAVGVCGGIRASNEGAGLAAALLALTTSPGT